MWAEEDDPRVTRVGRVIRKLRIDELPQFINIIRGETKAAERLMRKAVSSVERGRGGDYEALFRAAANLFWFEEYATARGLLERLVSVGRDLARTFLPVALDTLAAVDVRTGRLASASAKSTEALRLARLAGQCLVIEHGLAFAPASVGAREGAVVAVPDCEPAGIQPIERRRRRRPATVFSVKLVAEISEGWHRERVKAEPASRLLDRP